MPAVLPTTRCPVVFHAPCRVLSARARPIHTDRAAQALNLRRVEARVRGLGASRTGVAIGASASCREADAVFTTAPFVCTAIELCLTAAQICLKFTVLRRPQIGDPGRVCLCGGSLYLRRRRQRDVRPAPLDPFWSVYGKVIGPSLVHPVAPAFRQPRSSCLGGHIYVLLGRHIIVVAAQADLCCGPEQEHQPRPRTPQLLLPHASTVSRTNP